MNLNHVKHTTHVRYVKHVLTVFFVLLLLISQTSFGAKSADESKRIINEAAIRVMDYAFPDEHLGTITENPTKRSLSREKTSDAVGHVVGSSYYEWQHNGSMHRQIAVGSSESCPWTMHVAYMYLPSSALENREIELYGYDGASNPGTQAYFYGWFQSAGHYMGYTSIDVTTEGDYAANRVIFAAHNRLVAGGRYRIQYWFQYECNLSFFGASDRVPDTLNDCGTMFPTTPDEAEVVWPDIAYQDPPDGLPVLHMIGRASGRGSGPYNFNYFQKIDPEGIGDDPDGGTWVYGCAIDTVFTCEAYDLCASNDGTVAITWVGLLPDVPGCDTCSQNSSTGDDGRDRWDNDLYVQINRNYGRGWLGDPYDGTTNFWENRINVTKNVPGSNGFRPFADISTMITTDQVYHIAYVAMEWDDSDPGTYRSRIFHWSEDLDFLPDGQGNVRTIAAAQWDPLNCNPGICNQNQAKLSIAECNGNLYVMWVELNSPLTTGNENHDDCAQRAFEGDLQGAANGDLFISVSDDGGLTWDYPRPLTDTYGGPTGTGSGLGCDPEGVEGNCPSEHWPTMVEHGSDFAVNPPEGEPVDWNQSTTFVGTGNNGYFLDIAYFNDLDAGGAIIGYGNWTDNDYLWMRIPCYVPSTYNPCSGLVGPSNFKFPNYIKHCENYQDNSILENIGNTEITYTVEIVEESPAGYSGWLKTYGEDGIIPAGINNKDTIVISINDGNMICSPGTIVKIEGKVIFTFNEIPNCTGEYIISSVIADTVLLPWWDTVSTSCTDLIVGTNGNAGNFGSPGGANMDYAGAPEEPDENADIYLYDCGDICGWMSPEGAYMNWGMFQATIADSVAFMPQYDPAHLPGSGVTPYGIPADYFYTGIYTTNDTSLIFETEWIAPTDAEYSCGFVIKHTKVYVNNSLPKSGVTIGMVADFDIPSDNASIYNAHGFGPTANMVWMQGLEFNANDPWDNSLRYGALLYLGGYNCSSAAYEPSVAPDESFDNPYGMYTGNNSRLVYPYDLGFNSDTLYMMHSLAGETLSDWFDPYNPTDYYDMHCGITYLHNRDFAANDTLHFFVAILTNVDNDYPAASGGGGINNIAADARAFFEGYIIPPTCNNPGDANGDGVVGITDLIYFVDFMFNNGPPPVFKNDFDVSHDCLFGISDITYFVSYMFENGPAPVCGCIP